MFFRTWYWDIRNPGSRFSNLATSAINELNLYENGFKMSEIDLFFVQLCEKVILEKSSWEGAGKFLGKTEKRAGPRAKTS